MKKIIKTGLATEMEIDDENPLWKKIGIDPETGRQLLFSSKAANNKRLAPLFNKPWRVSIVDDDKMATSGNPGMFGFSAPMFEVHSSYEGEAEHIAETNTSRLSLEEIADRIEEYKKTLQTAK